MPAPPNVSNVGAQVNLTIAQATDFGPATLTFTNPDGTPVDLTGVTLTADIRVTPQMPVVASFTVAVSSPSTAGIATMVMPDSVTATLEASNYPGDTNGNYVWDLKMLSASGLVSRPLFGNVVVWREITP